MQQNNHSKLLLAIQNVYDLKNPLFREKIIILTLSFIEQQNKQMQLKQLLELLPFNFETLFQEYINSINNEDQFQICKAFDILNQKPLQLIIDRQNFIRYQIQLLKMIAQQYKQHQNYHVALKTIKYVIELEQKLGDQISIISSKMSLVTILSTAGQHTQALAELNVIHHYINQQEDLSKLKKLMCIMYYNFGVEWEHLGQLFQSQINLSQALEIAKSNKFDELILIIEQAIQNIKKQK